MLSSNYPVNNYYPTVSTVEVVATQPTAADVRNIENLRLTAESQIDNVAYIVKLDLDNIPEISSLGFNIYVGEFRIRKYSGCRGGIYFKVYDPQFFSEYGGQNIRFSIDGITFQDSGQRLPEVGDRSSLLRTDSELSSLPSQEEVLGWK